MRFDRGFLFNELTSLLAHNRLHYIPLSTSYKEIHNIHSFFSGATESVLAVANSTSLNLPAIRRRPIDGDRRLRRIARAGKQWMKTFGRQADMVGKFIVIVALRYPLTSFLLLNDIAYVYRLCLEYARLSADVRDSMNFTT